MVEKENKNGELKRGFAPLPELFPPLL